FSFHFRITKPLTFADCVGDELPLGWEVVYDQQIGVYYIDHINKITQIEDPRTLWRQEQERMLKEYLVVAKEALDAKKEIYLIKQQRLELAQQEYLQLHQLAEEDIRSHVSSFSGSSSNTKYDPDQIKAEIARRRERLSGLKQELVQMKQELQYKELGVETLQEIDRKMSSSQTNYKLDEAQAIINELRTIKRSINTGEKERQDLIQDSVSALLARTTAQLEAVERELAGEQVKLEYTDEEIQEMERKEEQAEAVSERSWQAESVDSGCSNSTAFGPHCPEGLCGEVAYREPEGRCAARGTRPPPLKVDKETNTESLFPEKLSVRLKDRGSHRSHGSPFVRSSTIVRSQTFSPGAQSQYVCRLYRSDSDSSTLPKRSPFIRNTLERRTLRYKQQSYRSSLEEQSTRTSLDLELDLQASRTRQRQLNEELSSLRELRLRLEEAQGRGITELPHWVIRDERFRCLLREAERQAKQTKQEQRQEEAAERMLRKASKEVLQMRGQNQKESLPVQTFREKIAFFTRPRLNIPPLPADDV
ncbi:UNVERIFIED_CONTAM: hypothetical protein FKN15_046638, partial [Acipenser sinensis]